MLVKEMKVLFRAGPITQVNVSKPIAPLTGQGEGADILHGGVREIKSERWNIEHARIPCRGHTLEK